MERIRELYEYVIELKNEPDLNESDRQAVESIIERIRTGKGLIKNDLAKIILRKKREKSSKSWKKASEDDLKRVGKSICWHRNSTLLHK